MPAIEVCSRIGRAILNGLLPPRCIGCGAGVAEQATLCAACWTGIRFVGSAICRRCGRPLANVAAPEPICGACAASPPVYDRARSALVYDDGCRRMVLRFKHGGHIEAVPVFARWLLQAGAELVADADVVVPVPLHRWRLMARGFNQSALLARALPRTGGPRLAVDGLLRTRATDSQQGLSATARQRNITSTAFTVHPRHCAAIADRRVLLVDDVLTTGATVSACARTLLQAGARAVDVLTLARTDRPDRVD
ncbi:double zinc ribbon domain-containing protein [Marinivivus vitaminiproducens]|uniref:double zinc ribbon domain-containing protein n=1 Tax=Marinivivus vitaminiproducens TaxID=3035935 RepID=UPI0027A3D0AA|nr:ComF family protein [Geminicoccaceae bacterium SCSIO 64248]